MEREKQSKRRDENPRKDFGVDDGRATKVKRTRQMGVRGVFIRWTSRVGGLNPVLVLGLDSARPQ